MGSIPTSGISIFAKTQSTYFGESTWHSNPFRRITTVAEWIRRFTRKRMVKNRGSSPVWGEKSSSSFSSQKSKTYPRRTGSTNAIRFTHQDGRVVKALDLSSNGRMSAWVRSPLLVTMDFRQGKSQKYVSTATSRCKPSDPITTMAEWIRRFTVIPLVVCSPEFKSHWKRKWFSAKNRKSMLECLPRETLCVLHTRMAEWLRRWT